MIERNGVQHFWSPPNPSEVILGMATYQDMIIVATNYGVYVITDHGRPLPDWEVRKITSDWKRSLRDYGQ